MLFRSQERVAEIEDVDLIGSASDLADLTRVRYGEDHCYDWILSSHNIEHIPNPIRFLQQCSAVLRPRGVLRLAVPDKRFCFDHFRPLSDVSELLQAFHENRMQPTEYQIFREESLQSAPGPRGIGWTPARRNLSLYREWFGVNGRVPTEYIDTHCWAFTPESFELIILDLVAFGLVDLEIDSISNAFGCEFFVDLRRPAKPVEICEDEYYAAREWLLCRCIDGTSANCERPKSVRFIPDATEKMFRGEVQKRSVRQRVLREARRLLRQLKGLARTDAA